MRTVLGDNWALLLGMFLLMLGNGLQGSVLGVRGGLEGFDSTTMGAVMAGYFLGFLGGAQMTPALLRRVGHVRVFAALASLISAGLIVYAAVVHPVAWFGMRVLVGFCFAGVYVVAESWLNDGATNETRGTTLSLYLIVQMMGIVLAQALLGFGDPSGYALFVVMSVAVSIAVAPILLSVSPTPVYETGRAMSLRQLFVSSPLGCVGCFLLGAVFACLFGMTSVYGSAKGMTNGEIAFLFGAIYLGGLVCQFPLGWISDRMDRRHLIALVTAGGAIASFAALLFSDVPEAMIVIAFVIGGAANPLYSLLIAHTNDFLEHEDMASASAGLIQLNGVGAAGTPVLVGYLMDRVGAESFMVFIGAAFSAVAAYAVYRMGIRPATPVDETLPVSYVTVVSTPAGAEAQAEWIYEQSEQAQAEAEEPDAANAPQAPTVQAGAA